MSTLNIPSTEEVAFGTAPIFGKKAVSMNTAGALYALAYLASLKTWDFATRGQPPGLEINFETKVTISSRRLGLISVERLIFDFEMVGEDIVATNELIQSGHTFCYLVQFLEQVVENSNDQLFNELNFGLLVAAMGPEGRDITETHIAHDESSVATDLNAVFNTTVVSRDDVAAVYQISNFSIDRDKKLLAIFSNGEFRQLGIAPVGPLQYKHLGKFKFKDISPVYGKYHYRRDYIPWTDEGSVHPYLSVYSKDAELSDG